MISRSVLIITVEVERHLDLQDELEEQTSVSLCPGGGRDVDPVPVVGRDDEGGRDPKSWSAGREEMGPKRPGLGG